MLKKLISRDFLTSLLEILGLIAVILGVFLINIPAGFIVGGLLAVGYAVFVDLGGVNNEPST